jgi:MerR family transcriptional regulator, light-induced transcriptional regulator
VKGSAVLSDRVFAAEQVRRLRDEVSREVTREFLERHPDWSQRYGDRARIRGEEDAFFHLDFLSGSIESGSDVAFADYGRWARRVLLARGLDPKFLVENLEQIQKALEVRLPDVAAKQVDRLVRVGIEAIQEKGSPGSDEASETELYAEAQAVFQQAILQGHRRAASNIAMELLQKGHSLTDIYYHVLQRSLYSIGELWEANRITVAEEHMATAICQYVIATLYEEVEFPDKVRGSVVITGVQGELHQVGANMVSDVLESMGWDVRFLGTNMPHTGILSVIEEHKPQMLGISATMLFNLPSVRALIQDVRARFGINGPRIVVGGAAFRSAPGLYREIGADAFASDIRELVQQLEVSSEQTQ